MPSLQKAIKHTTMHRGTLLILISVLPFLASGCLLVPAPSQAGGKASGDRNTDETAWAPPSPTVWNFDDMSNRLKPSRGKGSFSPYDPLKTGWDRFDTAFGKASRFGTSPLPGGDADVMRFPTLHPRQGFQITHGAAPNGVFIQEGFVSNYTLVMDLLWPVESFRKFRALYQTDSGNRDDAEMYMENGSRGGIGINGIYHGETKAYRWHRIAIVVQAASGPGGVGQLHKFIDGEFVGGHGTESGGPVSKWALRESFILFADNNGETAPGYLSSVYFIDRNLSMEEVAALGGPHAGGADIPGPAPKRTMKKLSRAVGIVAHRGESCCAPENTLTAIRRAFDRGAAMVEVDLRWSGDGVAVLMHDETVDRTTDGAGEVSTIPLKTLKQLDAGSWFGPEFRGERIPTLAEALVEAKGRGRLILDVKGYRMGVGIKKALKEAGVGSEAVYLWQNKVDEALEDFRKHLPDAGILWGGVPENLSNKAFADLKTRGVVGFELDLQTEKVTRRFIEAARRHNMFVVVYTVLDPEEMRRSAALGVDAIETDFTGVLKGLLP